MSDHNPPHIRLAMRLFVVLGVEQKEGIESMHRIGITLDPSQIKQIAALANEVDVLEVKTLDPRFLLRHITFFCRFGVRTMHVQYLAAGYHSTTLNLSDKRLGIFLSNPHSPLRQAYELLKPLFVSFHLGFSAERLRTVGRDRHNVAASASLPETEVFRRVTHAVAVARSNLRTWGYRGKILVENLDYHPTGAYEHVCQTGFIRRVALSARCGLLLDLSHLIITANAFKADPLAMVRAMGPELIYEVHVAAPLLRGGRWWDVNRPFYESETVLQLIRLIATQARRPLLFNLECSIRIPDQIKALRDLLTSDPRSTFLRR
ncbi:MAG: multinuclear nonheme iron-dependent oxidase [Kiritimatiellia bacterium]